jgi:CheY-like chemotaxis protein
MRRGVMQEPDKKYILLIEDNLAIADAFIWILEFKEYVVVTKTNGRDALHFIEDNHSPTLILLDLMMPIMNGFEFLEIKNKEPHISNIPTIIITASELNNKKIKLKPHEYFFKKPFDFDAIIELIEKIYGDA